MSGYKEITQDEAWDIMEHKTGFQIVDVRTPEEYGEGHIKGAVNIPLETINGREIPELPDRSQELLVYCRSGNRSKTASSALAELGYTNIYDFGGINTWPYETES